MSDADLRLTLRVAAIENLAAGVRGFTFVAADAAAPLPSFSPGAHLPLCTPSGVVRSYSLCAVAGDTNQYQIAVKRESDSRGGSASLHDATRVGDLLRAALPRNAFALVAPAKAYLFIAGGIGITPILSMIRTLAADELAPPWKLVYLGRDPAGMAFTDELRAHGQRVAIHCNEGDSAQRFDLWPLLEKPNTAELYCCGPRGLMEAVRDMTGHWSNQRVHFESFIDGATPRPDDRPFRVRLARSGDVLDVPVGTSILSVLRAHGCAVMSSCESGCCGSCRVALTGGVADHRDMVLLPEEMDSQVMVCVSRAKDDLLELDL